MGGTSNWDQYRLAQIWEMVRNESTAVGERQAQAWTTTAELCEDQANQLERAAAQLAQTWVPTPGTAAAAFQGWLAAFTMSMRESASAARANSIAITDITYQMASAREGIAKLIAKGNAYQQAESSGPPHVTVPGRVPPPNLTGAGHPPLGWRAGLDEEARATMLHTETAVISTANRMQIEAAYEPNPLAETIDPHRDGTEPGSGVGGGGISSNGAATTGTSLSPFIPVPTLPATLTSDETSIDDFGVGLAGSPAPMAIGERFDVQGTTPPHVISGLVTTPAGPALPPGGVIGAPPTSITPIAGPTRAPGVVQSSRTGSGTGSAPLGRGASAGSPMMPMVPPARGLPGGGTTAGRTIDGGRRRRSADPSDQWFVAEGGPSVIEPSPEPLDHDPGPGVIGIDR